MSTLWKQLVTATRSQKALTDLVPWKEMCQNIILYPYKMLNIKPEQYSHLIMPSVTLLWCCLLSADSDLFISVFSSFLNVPTLYISGFLINLGFERKHFFWHFRFDVLPLLRCDACWYLQCVIPLLKLLVKYSRTVYVSRAWTVGAIYLFF